MTITKTTNQNDQINKDNQSLNKNLSINKIKWKFNKRKNYQIVKLLNKQNVYFLYFYTHINNVLRILEYGIQPIETINLNYNEEYIVWNYLQHQDYVKFELSSTTRHYFWQWINKNNINKIEISYICIGLAELYNNTKSDWEYNQENKSISLYETAPASTIRWIMINNNKYDLIENYIKNQELNVKLYFSEEITNNE